MKKRNKIITENKGTSANSADTELSTQSTNEAPTVVDTADVQSDKPQPSDSEKPTDTASPVAKDTHAKADTDQPSNAEKTSPQHSAKSNSSPGTDSKKPSKTKASPPKTAAKPASEPQPAPSKEAKSASPAAGKIALVISLIALGLTGFQYYQGMQAQSTAKGIDQQITSLKQELSSGISAANDTANSVKSAADASIAKANAAIATVNDNLSALQQAESQKSSDLDALQARLTKSIQQVEASGLQQNSRKDWLLAEVEYLLRLANQRVLMENTPIGALALLESADKILQQTDDVSIFSVRKSLAADIAALSVVPHLDQEGLYLKIDALSNQINQLKLVPITDKKQLPKIIDQVATDAIADAGQSNFSKIWDSASAKLAKLVVISNRDNAIKPLLTPAQQAGLLQNLHILFEQTQLSLLQRKQVPYLRSIEKAQLIINSHFEAEDATSQALLKGLSSLKEQQISVELPSIAGSLNALKAYLKQGAEIKSGAQSQ